MKILTNKSYKTYDYLSRYSSFPFYFNTFDQKYIYGTTSHLNKNTVYTLHKINKNETLDSIALQMYNNPTLFWVIADYNNIQNPYEKLIEGNTLKIPTLTDVSYQEN